MIYPENFESKIKFDKIRSLISRNCRSEMGKALVEQMCFSDRKEQIEEAQKEVAEFMRIMREEEFPDNRYTDARSLFIKNTDRGFVFRHTGTGRFKEFTGIFACDSPFFSRENRNLSGVDG